jgi:hypothetical protein
MGRPQTAIKANSTTFVLDTKQYNAEVNAFIDQMKRKMDNDKYDIITGMMKKAAEPMLTAAKAMAPVGTVTHKYTSKKTDKEITFTPGFLRSKLRLMKLRKRTNDRGMMNPAVRITGFNKDPYKSAYYAGMVNLDHTVGRARTSVRGKFFFQKAREANKDQFHKLFESLMIAYLKK